ncbi:MAG: FAD-dependent oxidoreductase [Dehalococcoidia bacterium]|nr:FAD-dependent oxidoreductase [Dehalococcoidia bacterium]
MNEEKLARNIQGEIEKATGKKATVSLEDSVVILSGHFPYNQSVVNAGHIAAGFEQIREVINDIDYPGKRPIVVSPKVSDELYGEEFDVVIVGGGIIGVAIARELSRFNLTIAVIERHDDLGMDQTAHSNAMVHPAIVTEYGTLKWEMSYKGNPMWDEVAAQLDIDCRRIGTLAVAENPDEELLLPYTVELAKKHHDPTPKVLDRGDLDKIEPGLASNIRKGMLVWNTGIISPFEVVLAYAENAITNGVQFFPSTSVMGVRIEDSCIKAVDTTRGTIRTHILVNAAGLYADKIAEFAGDRFFTIHPRKGETIIFDKSYQPVKTSLASFSMAANRDKYSKGGGIIPTIDGNLSFGPTAEEVGDREDVSTTFAGYETLFSKFAPVLERLKPYYEKPDRGKIITHFAGCRAATYKEDFIIEPSKKVKGLVHAAGIQSPGIASAPAIAERVKEIVIQEWRPSENIAFEPRRKRSKHFSVLDPREIDELVHINPRYGHIVCRCENVSEGEIEEALQSGIPARSIDAIKRRTRAGMGRCQGGFCMPRVLETISQDANINKESVTKSGGESYILCEQLKAKR